MGWVLKELRTDVTDTMREDAERDARRIRRLADRAASLVGEDLRELEKLAVELQGVVRRQRSSTAVPVPVPVPVPAPVPVAVAPPVERHRRGRASMRSSPLTDLLRAKPSRPRFPRALLEAR